MDPLTIRSITFLDHLPEGGAAPAPGLSASGPAREEKGPRAGRAETRVQMEDGPAATLTVRPPEDAVVDAQAARLNGYTRKAWADAPEASEVLPKVAEALRGCIVAGHNPAFDWAFLTAAFRRAGLPPPDVDYHLVDTASLAWPLLRKGKIPSLSLKDLCAHFKVPKEGAHRAMADVERAFAVYRHLLEVVS